MKKILLIIAANFITVTVFSQFIYKIKADSVLITNDSCNAELNLENSTRSVKGFLYNKGNGRTEFRKGVIKINDTAYLIGADTLITGGGSVGFSAQDGLIKTGSNLYLGNTTFGSGPHNFTANRHQYLNNYYYSIGGTARDADSFPVFRFYSNGDFTSKTTNQYTTPSPYKNGIRYNARLGYLQVGLSSIIDTTVSNNYGIYETNAIILNTDSRGNIAGQLLNAFIGAYNVQLPAGKVIASSMLTGGSFFLGGNLSHVVGGGVFHSIPGNVNGSLIMGNSQQISKNDDNSGWFGFYNHNANGRTYGTLTAGWVNNIGASGQLTVGTYLTNKSHASTALGNGNVNFTSLPYNAYDSIFINNTQNIEGRYLLFSLGNSESKTAATKSNAMSVLYNGRTQINTTGFSNNLAEADVTPKAALEVVSTNSGVLLPKLTTTQRNTIAAPDLHNGLLLYNTDDSKFQFYNGTYWKSICDSCVTGGGGSGWGLTGNAGINPATNFLGTTDAQPLIFKTNNVEAASVSAAGEIYVANTTDQGNYQLQVGGNVWNNGSIHMAATSPILSFYLGTGAGSDYWMGRSSNSLIISSASILEDKIGNNSWYNGSLANGHRWFDGAVSPAVLMQLKTDGEFLIGTGVDNGAYRLQTNTPVSGNAFFVDASANAGIGYKFKAKDQAWVWHAENGIAQVGLQNQVSGTQWTLDASNTTLNIQGRTADVKLITDASGDIYLNTGRKLKVNLGSDATGDIFYRNSTGDFTRLPIGTANQVLTVTSGLPTWAAPPSGSGGFSIVKKTADENRANTTTLTNDAALTIALAAGTTYHIRGKIFLNTANATMDYKFALSYSGTTSSIICKRTYAAAGAVAGTDNENTLAQNTIIGSTAVAATTTGIAYVEIDVTISTTTSGTFGFQWAQNTSNGSNLTVLKGSYLEYLQF